MDGLSPNQGFSLGSDQILCCWLHSQRLLVLGWVCLGRCEVHTYVMHELFLATTHVITYLSKQSISQELELESEDANGAQGQARRTQVLSPTATRVRLESMEYLAQVGVGVGRCRQARRAGEGGPNSSLTTASRVGSES